MAINSTYYINAATFDVATSVYLDVNLTYIAPDGVYKFGSVVRQQSSGILLEIETCVDCTLLCGTNEPGAIGQGIYLTTLNVGSSTGAIVLKFQAPKTPSGIRVIYDGVVYNKLSSPVNGLHQSSSYGNFTIIGDSDDTGTCDVSWYPSGGTVSLNEYIYDTGTYGFIPTGGSQSVSIASGDISLDSFNQGLCVMVIPKTSSAPDILNIEAIGPCTLSGFDIFPVCPEPLPSFNASVRYEEDYYITCSTITGEVYYFQKVNITSTYPIDVTDYVFSDENGQYPLADGYYLYDSGIGYRVLGITDGIVTSNASCTP